MSTVVIANPVAGAGHVGRRQQGWRDELAEFLGPCDTLLTRGCADATVLTRQAILSGAQRIVVVGGDGTLNEVVNGFFSDDGSWLAGEHSPELMLAPVGTGSDFARCIGWRLGTLGRQLEDITSRSIDLGRVELLTHGGKPTSRYFINLCSFGSSGLVVDKVNHATKLFGAKASFLWGTICALLAYKNSPIRLTLDGEVHEGLLVNMVAVANGRFFGGGMKIAPTAYLDDGYFDVVVVGDIGLPYFFGMCGKLYRGEHLGHAHIRHFRAREITAEPLHAAKILVDVDGEQPGRLPVRYQLLPRRMNLLAPWSRAEAVMPAAS